MPLPVGGTYPEGTLRLKNIQGAEYIPFYVAASTRTKSAESGSIEITCSPPEIAIAAQTDVTGSRQIIVTIGRPSDNGSRITKILIRWWSSERLLNQIQKVSILRSTNYWYHIDSGGSSSSGNGLLNWYPPIRETTCGTLLNGESMLGGYNTFGNRGRNKRGAIGKFH